MPNSRGNGNRRSEILEGSGFNRPFSAGLCGEKMKPILETSRNSILEAMGERYRETGVLGKMYLIKKLS